MRRSEKEMNRLYLKVCVSLFVICIALYGINEVLQTYQFEESKNDELPQQPTESNRSDVVWRGHDFSDPYADHMGRDMNRPRRPG